MRTLLHSGFGQKVQKTAGISVRLLVLAAFSQLAFLGRADAQDAFITSEGLTTICEGESTTLQVIIGASEGPYTVVYSDGTSNFTVSDYESIADPEDPDYGGDPIPVSPVVTTTYSLVSVHDGGNNSLPVSSATITITVNPLPTNLVISVNPASPVCPSVNFTISATATNGNAYELWNQANTVKTGDLPYITSITSSASYTVRAISSEGCSISQALTVNIESTPPTITCPGNQTLNPGAGTCSASLPDYRGSVTVNDNCTPSGSIVLSQSPAPGTVISGHNTSQTITITATDAAGNSNSCNFNGTLVDNINPQISCVGNQTVPASASCTYTHSGTAWNPAGTDNCTVASVVYSLSGATTGTGTNLNGVTFQPGTTTVTWIVTDGAGRTSQCSFNVSIEDTEDPTVTCPGNQSVNTAAGVCTYTHSGTTWNVTADDNCTVASISYVLTGATTATIPSTLNGAVFNIGLTTVTVTVADGATDPNTANCSFTVTVSDNQDPTISCPSNISVSNDAGNCTASVNVPAIVFGDNCSGSSIAWSSTDATTLSGNGQIGTQTFNIGTTTITVIATDAANRTAQCSFTVTVSDTENPTIGCPSDISADNGTGLCTASVVIPSITFDDNCAGESISWSTAGVTSLSGNGQPGTQTFNVGVTTITVTVTDAANNTASCSFSVTITDNEDPTITCPSNITASNGAGLCSASIVVPAVTFGDNCSGPAIAWTLSGATTGSGNGQIGTRSFSVGITTVNYTVSDGASPANTATCSFTITISDNEAPVISGCPANITRTSGAGVCTATVSWTEPTATDNCTTAGNLVWTKSHLPGSVFSAGTTNVTYTATDAAGNISNVCSFTVTVVDNQKPVISGCPTNITTGTGPGSCNAVVTWTEPTATDNCTASGSLVWTKSHIPGATFNTGTTTVTYTVADAGGNISNPCSFTVTVTDNIAPTAICKPATIYLNGSGAATLAISDVNDGSTDNCTAQGSLVITLSKTSFNCSNLGASTVVMTVRDASGNQSTCNATVTVVDNTPPVISATAGTVTSNVNASSGVCYYTVNGNEFDPTVTDNCAGSVLSYSVTGATTLSGTGSLAGKQLSKGANLITWSATDGSGNTVIVPLTFTKTVVDNQPPTISSIGNQNRNTNTGCAYTVSGTEFDPTYNDNCGAGNLIITYTINGGSAVQSNSLAGVLLATGINTIVWTASDGLNQSTSTFRVTVADDDAPSITSISNITIEISVGCGAVVNWTEPVASDNCAVTVFGQVTGLASGSTFPIGTTLIRYRALDAAGNSTFMSFNVIVIDLTPPDLTCPSGSPFARVTGAGVCFYTVSGTEFDPTTNDGCPVTAINSFDGTNTLAGKQLPAGNHTINWTATDGSGNISTCSVEVNVTDNQNPTFDQPTGNPAGSYAYSRNTDPGVCYYTVPGTDFDLRNIYDNCTTETPTYVVTKNGSTVFTGSGTLAGLQLPKDQTYPYSFVWTLEDANGNTVTATAFTILVLDNQPPQFVCHGNEIRTAPGGSCNYTISGTEFDPTSLTDNCDIPANLTVSYTLDGVPGAGTTMAGIILSAGVHTIVWTIEDLSGNINTCTFTVTIRDTVFPTITPIADQSRFAPSTSCDYTAIGTEFDPVVNDNCPSPLLVNNQNGLATLNGFVFPVGITVVVWTATDASDNATTMEFEVNVIDNIPPDYDIPAAETRSASSSHCYYTVVDDEFDPRNIEDNCTDANFYITNDYNNYRSLAYEQFPVGITEVVWTVRDFHGNVHNETITITIDDDTDPVINCPSNAYVRVVDVGQTYYTVGVNEFTPVTTDNCAVISYTNNINSGSNLNGYQLPTGTHNITWTSRDGSGNDTECTFTVYVVTDLYPPVTCVGDQLKSAGSGVCSYTVIGTEFDATSTSGAATLLNNYDNTSSLAGSVFPVGTTLVTWTASQVINGTNYSNSCSFYVTVVDNENPVITPASDVLVTTNSGCYATSVDLGSPSTSDNCSVYTTWNNAPYYYGIGITTVTWWVEDIHGNTSSATQTVTVTDDDDPYLSCPGSICRQVDDGQSYYTVFGHEFDPYGTWDCSGILSITNDFNGNASLAGAQIPTSVTSITWTVTDNASNVSTCTIAIDIRTTDPPAVTCRGNETRTTDPDECSYVATGGEFDVSSTQSSPVVVLTHNIQTTTPGTLPYAPSANSLAGAEFPTGTTTIVWTATSGSDVNTCCTFTVHVYDDQDPSVSWPDNVTVNVDLGGCDATGVIVGSPTASDNCTASGSITATRTPSGTTFSIGTTNIYWTVHDLNGNYVYHTQTVTVVDNISPDIDCPLTTYYREFNNSTVNYYTVVGTEFRPNVTENCSLTSYINNRNGWTTLNGVQLTIGNHAIVWTATDASSNTDQCTVNITVVDSFEPLLSCPEDAYLDSPSDQCTHTVSGTDLDPVYTNLSVIPGRTLTHNFGSAPLNTTLNGAAFPIGTTTVTWTAVQNIGGIDYTSTCTYDVIVRDRIAPVVDLPFPNVSLPVDDGECYSTAALTPPTATDNCTAPGSLTITSNSAMYFPFLVGVTNIRWTITDASGNQTVYTQQVTVFDDEGPVITNCPVADVTGTAAGENCEAVVSWPPLVATDECSGVASFTSTHSPGTLFPVGTTAVTYTATDNEDNVSTCVFNVVVNDTPPSILCVGDKTRNTNSGNCSYLVLGNELDPVDFEDNCSTPAITWSFIHPETGLPVTGNNTLSGVAIPRGSNNGPGTGEITITWTATDENLNFDDCSFVLTIVDAEAPVIVVPGNQTRSTDLHQNYYTVQGGEFDDVTASDNCGIVTKLVNEYSVPTLAGLQLQMGENTITWFAEDDMGNRSQAVFYAYVIDTEPPRVTNVPENITVNTLSGCSVAVNYTPPVIIDNVTLVGDLVITVSPDYALPGYVFPVGVTEVTYTVVDETGNSLVYTFDVTVIDNINPTLTCAAGSPGNEFHRGTDLNQAYYTTSGTEFDPTEYFDNCAVTLTNNRNSSESLAGVTFPVGTTTVTWTATDASNNVTTCSIQVIVEDDQNPLITNCPDATVAEIAESGECYYLVPGSEYDPYGFSDNDDLDRLTYAINGGVEVGTDLSTTLVGQQIPVGTTTIIWRLYDVNGNVSNTCQTIFTITDPEPPTVVTVGTQTRSTDNGVSTYTAKSPADDDWNPSVSDNCEVDIITYAIDGGTPVGTDELTSIIGEVFATGTHTVLWTATDIHGNISTGSYQVIVEDEDDPTAVCNPYTVYLDENGIYMLDSDDINAIGAGSTDPGGIAEMTVTPDVFDCADTGDNTVLLTVTDNSGNTATCNATLTVIDNTPPDAVCTDISVSLDVLGLATILPADLNGGSSDECGILGYSASQTLFDCSDVGANSVILTVTDNSGNTSTCTATVTVYDNYSPSAVCNPITVSLDATGNLTLSPSDIDNLSFGSTDNCSGSLTKTVTPDDFDCSDIGSNTVILRVTDPAGNFDECTTTVTVQDIAPPTAICRNITVQLDAGGNVTIVPADINNGSSDNCDASLTYSIDQSAFTCADLGPNTVTLTVTDDYSNSSTCTSIVTVEDNIDPVVTCSVSDQTVNTDNDECTYTHSGTGWNAGATDGCTTIASLTYTLSGLTTGTGTSLDGVVFNRGITTVTWTATDGSGNVSNCSYTVTVNDTQAPDAVCQDITIQLNASGAASIVAADINNGSTDNCGIQGIAVNTSAFDCTDLGPNPVTLTVTDIAGNTATCNANVTVEDNIDPLAVCKNITVQLNAAGTVTITGADVDNGSTDNCSIDNRSVTPDTFTCVNIGTPVTVTLTVTDPAGNTDQCTATVTVEDNVDPNAVCRNITVQLDGSGNASIVAGDINNGSSDACGIASLAASQTAFDCSDLGPNTVTLTVTDNNSNQSTCNATVTVQDQIDPAFTFCPANQTVTTDPDVCTHLHSGTAWDALASDNCSVSTLTYNLTGVTSGTGTSLAGVSFNNGLTTVTWTATDASGNNETCVFTVTVNDEQDPDAACQAYTAQLQRNGQAVVSPADIDDNSDDNCGIVLYEISKTGGAGTWASTITYSCSDIGAPTAYLRVTDAAGNTSSCSSTVTVADTQAPTLDDLSDRNEVTDNNVCTYTHNDDLWNPTDNCDLNPTITYSLSGATTVVTLPNTTLNGQVFNLGTTTVTWTVSDHATPPNTGSVEFDVVVTDTQDPVVTCPSNITQNVANPGDLSATVAGIPNAIYSDNCSVTMLTYALSGATSSAHQGAGINQLNSGTFNLGTTTVTYIAYDADGNSHSCNFTITINALPSNAVIVNPTAITTYENIIPVATFTVVLPTAPTGTVVFDVVSNDLTEGTVSTSSLTFNAGNWSTPQTVTVTGVNDDVDDDDIPYLIILTTNTILTDPLSGYYNVDPTDVDAVNIDNDVAGVTVSAISGPTTEAGGTATFTMVLNTEPTDDVIFTLSSSDLTEGNVTNPVTLTVTFTPANWDTPQTITVTGIDDEIDDGNVSYTIITSNATSDDPKYSAMVAADVPVINNDNDAVGFIVTPLTLNTTEAGGTATFTVVLTSKPATDAEDYIVVVDVESSDLTEGTVSPIQLTFTATDWDTPQTVTVTGVEDIVVDGNIAYTIVNTVDQTLTTDPLYDPLDPSDVSVTNADNDAATLSVNSIAQLETNSGTTSFVFTVTHSGQEVIGSYSVSYFTQNGTARSPSDFAGTGGSVTFNGSIGETQTITITVNGDQMVERNETFSLVLNTVTAPGRNVTILPAGKTGTGTITNDDNATLAINDVSITEGNAGSQTLTFTVTLSMAVEDGLSLQYASADGTATTADSDYATSTGTLTFTGNTNETRTMGVTVYGDLKVELDENFLVNLSNIVPVSAPAGTITFADDSGTGTITNDDAATLVVSGFSVNENAGTANYTVTLNRSVQTAFTVDFATSDNTALAGSDYTAVPTTTLNFGAGNPLVQTVTVSITNDTYVEPTETLTGTISNLNAGGQNVTIATATATGTILDNESASVAIDDVTVDEADGTATFTVTLTGNIQDNLTVNYATANNTALSASDYSATSGTLTFLAGSLNGSTLSVVVPITNDNIAEPTETYRVNLSGIVSTGSASISDAQGIGTINDNDPATLVLSGFTVTETNGTQTANFAATMSIAAQENVVLTFTTANGSAGASDFTAQTNTIVTIPGGTTSLNIPVSVLGDLIAEPTETFTGTIAISNVNGQQVTIDTPSATSTIEDDDIITINLAGFTVTETNGTQVQNFRASMNTTAQLDIVLEFSTSDGTAIDGNDYTARTAISVTILAGTLFTDIPVDILGDLITEPQETFTGTISLTNNNGQQASVGTATANGIINDNDPATLAITGFTADEDAGTADFTITLSRNVQNAFTVDFATSDITALAGALLDYTAVPTTTLTFGAANDLTQTVTVAINDDSWVEPTETLRGTLSNLAANSQAITIPVPTAVATINDNDAASIAIDDVTVAENIASGIAEFTVTLTGDVQDDLTVDFTTANITALAGSDYTLSTGVVTFAGGSLSGSTQTISIPVLNNVIAEPTETYHVNLSNIVCTGSASFGDNQGLGTITDDDPVTQIDLAGFTVTETDGTVSHNFVASMDIIAQEPVVISFTTTNGTAGAADFTAQSAVQYTILPGTLSVNIPIDVLGDLITEPQESFTGNITLINANGQQVAIGIDEATGIINDNDDAAFAITGFTVSEAAGTATYTVTLDNTVQNAITIDFATSNNTATAGLDYTAVGTTTLTFGAANPLSQTVTVPILEDLLVEPTETLTGTISNLINNSQDVTIATATATGTITDNDAATLAVNNVTLQEPDNGSTVEYIFIITQSGRNTDGPYTVAYTTTIGSASSGSDFVAQTGTVSFAGTSGESHSVTIIVNGDIVVEPNEIFTFDLSEDDFGGRNITFTDNSGLGTITDNDITTVNLVASDPAAAEPSNDGEFTVSMGLTSSTNTVVSYIISGDAVAGDDYTSLTGSVTIPAGSLSATIDLEVIDDLILEDDETVTITLSGVSGDTDISLGAPYIASVIISDDDVATVSITANDPAAAEPSNNGQFTVTMSNASDVATVISYTTSGTATAGSDYTALTGTITIPAGSTSGTIDVTVIDNLIMESNETVIVTLASITSGDADVSIGTPSSATVTIADNDVATVSIAASDPNASEPSNNGQYTVTMTSASDTDTQISYNVSGTATSGDDFNALSGSVTIPAGSLTATIDVVVNDDLILESSETVIATLSAITSGNSNITIGLPAAATVTITDNDAASLSIADVTVDESDGTATFTVLLTGNVQGGFTIDYATANNTAVQPGDYTSTSGTLTFAGTTGETETITVPITGNSIVEITETYYVNLSGISNALITYDSQATGTITDDDVATVSIASVTEDEGDSGTTTYTFTVTMNAASDAVVTVDYATANGTATTADLDYSATSGTLTFAAGNTSQTFTVSVNGDTRIEDDETFTADLSNLVTNSRPITLATSSGTGTITNDDAATISINDVTLAEGNTGTTSFTFTVSLSDASASTITVDYATSNGTATVADGDYIATAGTVVFSPGQVSKSIIVPVNGDVKVETDETFTVALSNLFTSGLDVTVADGSGTGSITNDDAATITINDVTLAEGNSGTTSFSFTVAMSHASDAAVTVDYTSANGTATLADSDYSTTSGTLTFAAGETSKTITVLVNGDVKVEDHETYTVGLSDLDDNGRDVSISDATGLGTITNDDSAILAISDISLAEGDSGTTGFTFTLTLSAASDDVVTIDYATADGTATEADADYTGVSGTITFAAGETSKTVTVLVNGDAKTETNETFTIGLTDLVTNGNTITLGTASATATITNDDNTPSIVDIVKSGPEDNDILFADTDFTAAFTDADADVLNSIEVVSLPANGTLYLSGIAVTSGQVIVIAQLDNLTFTPSGNWYGTTTFDYNATDGANWAADDARVIITITSENDAPVAVDDIVSTPEDTPLSGSVTLNDTDTEGNGLTVTQFVVDGITYLAGVTVNITNTGTLVINANGSFQFVPAANYNGTVPTATYTISDGNGGSDAADLIITVTPANDAPVTVDDAYTVCSTAVSTGNILTNGDADPDGTALTVNTTPVSDASHGTFAIESDGDYTYTPDAGYNGTDIVVVSVCDNGTPLPSLCTNATITFTVNEAVTSDAGLAQNLCDVTTTTLAGNDPTPGTGLWTLVSGPNTPAITSPTAYNSTVTSMVPGVYVFRWTISSGTCPSSESTVTITNYATPTTSTTGADQTICGLTSTSLGGNTPVNGTGAWSQTSGPGTTTFSASGSGNSTATATLYG
ncbi:MAG: Calx-beta domain-containing protein, partial [Bacteroidota bacterium]